MQRSKRNIAMAAGAAVIASSALSGAALVGSADAAPVNRTLKFVAVTDREHRAGRFGFEATEIERNQGRWVGYDVISGVFQPATNSAKIYVAVTRRGGILYGRLHNTSESTYAGRITGGLGRFAHATGTISARNAPRNENRTYVTIHYTLP